MPAVQLPYKVVEKRIVLALLASVALWFLSAAFLSPERWVMSVKFWSILWALIIGIWVGAGWNRT